MHYLTVARFPPNCITKSWTSLSDFIIREEYAHETFPPPTSDFVCFTLAELSFRRLWKRFIMEILMTLTIATSRISITKWVTERQDILPLHMNILEKFEGKNSLQNWKEGRKRGRGAWLIFPLAVPNREEREDREKELFSNSRNGRASSVKIKTDKRQGWDTAARISSDVRQRTATQRHSRAELLRSVWYP